MTDEFKIDARDRAKHLVSKIGGTDQPVPLVGPVPRGVVNPYAVRMVFFMVVSICMFATGVICFLSIWARIPEFLAWCSFLSLITVTLTLGALVIFNEAFAPLLRRPEPPLQDPHALKSDGESSKQVQSDKP